MNFEFIKLNDLGNTLSNISDTNDSQDSSIASIQGTLSSQGSQITNLLASGVGVQNQIDLISEDIVDLNVSGFVNNNQIELINNQIIDINVSGASFQSQIDFINSFDKIPSGGTLGKTLQFNNGPTWDYHFEVIDVKVSGVDGNNFYVFNDLPQNNGGLLKLNKKQKYLFNISDLSNSGYSLRFGDSPDGIHSSGSILYNSIDYNSESIIFNNVNYNIIFPFCLEASGFCGTGNNSSYISFNDSPRIISGDKDLLVDEIILVDESIDSNLYLPSGTHIQNSDKITVIPLNNGTGTVTLHSIDFNTIINNKAEIYFYNQWHIV
jgi:hypothetical protein